MKKTLIAAGIAAVVAAPAAMADTTVYGKMRTAYVSGDGNTSVTDYSHRFGFKGSEDLGNGLSAFYNMEFKAGTDSGSNVSNRQSILGVKGGFGTIQAGDQNAPEKAVMLAGKSLEDTIADRAGILGSGYSKTEGSYVDDAIAYISPAVNGFQVGVGLIADNATTDTWAAKGFLAKYSNGPLTATLGITRVDNSSMTVSAGSNTAGVALSAGTMDSESVSVAYKMGDLAVAGTYQKGDNDTNVVEVTNYLVDLGYTMGANTLIAAYGEAETENGATKYGKKETTLGVQHNLSKRTNVMVLWHDQDYTDSSTATDADNWAIQLNHSF